MAFSSGDPIEYGKALAEKTKSPLDYAGESIMDNFKKRRDTDYELEKLKGIEQFKSDVDDRSQKTQAQIGKDNALKERYKSGKGVYTINPMTGELEEQGNVPFNAIVRNKQSMPIEKMQSMQSGDIVEANFRSMLKDMEKDPELLFKVRAPLIQNAYPAARTTYESAIKEMLSETGGKTLTESEQRVAKSTVPSLKDWAVSKSVGKGDEANIAARASLKIMSELRKRATSRLRANDMNAAPEFTENDIALLRQEAADEYAKIKDGTFQSQDIEGGTGKQPNQQSGVDTESERQSIADKIRSGGYDVDKLKAIFKQRTGQDYDRHQQ